MSGDHVLGQSAADEWLDVTQLAVELEVTEADIMGWIAEGRDIPHFELGPGIIRFRRSELDRIREVVS